MNFSESVREGRQLFIDAFAIVTHFKSPPLDKANPAHLYQSSERVTDYCPIASRDGHDLPGLVDECVPSVAAVVDDIVEGFENPVGQPILTHELPDVFLTVEFGCARRQRAERDVVEQH